MPQHLRRRREQRGSKRVEHEQLPEEPLRSDRPERQRHEIAQVAGDVRVNGAHGVGRVERDRAEDGDREHERDADPAQALDQIEPAALSLEARARQHARQEEHESHQAHVLRGAQNVEAEPAVRIGDRESLPGVGFLGEGALLRDVNQIGEAGMEGEHDHDRYRAEIAQSEARF